LTPFINRAGQPDEPVSRWLRRQAPAWLMPCSIVLALSEAGIIIAQAALLALIFHAAVIEGLGVADLTSMLGWLLAIFLLRAGLRALRGVLSARASGAVRLDLRPRLFERVAAAGPLLSGKLGTGRLVTSLVDQVETLDGYYARFVPQLAAAVIIPALIAVAVATQNWLAGLLLALTAPLIPLFMALVGMGAEQLSRQHQQALGRLSGLFHDRLRGLDTIRRFGAEAHEAERLAGFSNEFRRRTMAVLRLAFLSSAVLEFFTAIAIASLAIYIGLGLLDYIQFGPAGDLTLGIGLFILLLAPEFFSPLRQLAQHWHDRANALAAGSEIRDLLTTPAARPEPTEEALELPRQNCPVQVNKLRFGYTGRNEILHGINLSIKAGERVLITGASGSGKSTLISLLAGFLAPESGTILFDRTRVDELTMAQLAKCRAWLGQSPVLFPGSIADNIALGQPGANAESIQRAAQLAAVVEFTDRLPHGLQTAVGQDGFGVSGGQVQRIALARALLNPRPILLLDEPTASLDPYSEHTVWKTVSAAASALSMTVICASHSRGATAFADRVFHLENGRLREQPHDG